jgi:hypothetical protein
MSVVWAYRFVCILCLLLALAASAVSYAPGARHLGVLLPAVFVAGSLLSGFTAYRLSRVPLKSPTGEAKAAWGLIVVLVVTMTLIVCFG